MHGTHGQYLKIGKDPGDTGLVLKSLRNEFCGRG